jgi:hypothetical protein
MKLKKWTKSPNFRPRVIGLMAAMTTLALLLNAAVAAAGELPDIGIDLSKAQRLSDSEMGQERGRFAINGQPILFFGLVMKSTLGPQPGLPGDMLSAGVALGVDLSGTTPKVTTSLTWATETDASLATPGSPPGSSGALGKLNGGVGQVVQIAGQGNTAGNSAVINLTTSAPKFVPPTAPAGTPCGTLCKSKIDPDGVQVMVSMPGAGSAAQTINPQSILQAIALDGNLFQAFNSLQIDVQLGPTSPNSVSGLSTVLQAIQMLPPH